MICESCRQPHTPADCVDAKAGLPPQWRLCCCQHRPRAAQLRPQPAEAALEQSYLPAQRGRPLVVGPGFTLLVGGSASAVLEHLLGVLLVLALGDVRCLPLGQDLPGAALMAGRNLALPRAAAS